MPLPIFPTLKGVTFPARRTPLWKTLHQEAASGQDNPVPLWSFPRWSYELAYDFLRSDGANLEWQALAAFFNQVQGSALVFQFADPDDGAATNQGFGIGNGVQTAFPLVRAMSGAGGLSFIEPVFAPVGTPTVMANGVAVPQGGISAPATPTLGQSAGGTIGATTYFAKITYVTNTGETTPSPEASFAVSANNLLTVREFGAAPSGAIGFNVYAAGSSGNEVLQPGGSIAIGGTWTEPTGGIQGVGAPPPASNSTGWTLGTQGLVTLGAVRNGVSLSWTGTFNWLCRFDDDAAEFEKFMSTFWRLGKIKFTTIKTQSK